MYEYVYMNVYINKYIFEIKHNSIMFSIVRQSFRRKYRPPVTLSPKEEIEEPKLPAYKNIYPQLSPEPTASSVDMEEQFYTSSEMEEEEEDTPKKRRRYTHEHAATYQNLALYMSDGQMTHITVCKGETTSAGGKIQTLQYQKSKKLRTHTSTDQSLPVADIISSTQEEERGLKLSFKDETNYKYKEHGHYSMHQGYAILEEQALEETQRIAHGMATMITFDNQKATIKMVTAVVTPTRLSKEVRSKEAFVKIYI